MKNKKLIIITAIFFLIINTTYYWEVKLGILAFPAFLLLLVVYLVLIVVLCILIYTVISEKFKNKQRLIEMFFLAFVLVTTFYRPFGFIDFEKLESKNVLEVFREGAANCMTTLNFKDNFTFKEKTVCFGVSEITGNYRISGDTIYFENINRDSREDFNYEFGIIEKMEEFIDKPIVLKLYNNKKDTIGSFFTIRINKLKIKLKSKKAV